jgi:hypothetical protein
MSKAKIRIENPFRAESVNALYRAEGAENSWCTEHGIDTNGNIYFHYLNGVTERFSRKEYIKRSRQIEQDNF